MENSANDETIPCPNYCGKEIIEKNIEDHLKGCPLQIVECGWCGLKQSRNVFKEHIILANPETEINNIQQCMQRQCDDLSKQQAEFRNYIKRFSDDIQNKDGVIQRLSDDVKSLTQQNKDINSKFQQCIRWNRFIGALLIIILSFVLGHHYWLQPQQPVPHYKAATDQTDNYIILADNFSKIWHEELTEMKTKHSNVVAELATFKSEVNGQIVQLNQSVFKEAKQWEKKLKKMEISFTKTTELATFKSEVNGQIVQLNQSVLKEAKQWEKQLKKMENSFTKTTELATFKSEVNGQIVQLNQSVLKEAKQWEKQLKKMENSFTKTTELATFKSEVNGQIVQLNQSVLKEVKQWEKQLKKMENSFTKTTELATFKSEVNGQIVQLNQSMLKEVKQWEKQLKKMENSFTKTTELATFKSEVNGQIVQLNQSMLKEVKQWEKQLKEMENSFTKTTAELATFKSEVNGQIFWLNQSMLYPPKQLQKLMIETCTKAVTSEIHKLKMDSNIAMDEIKCPLLVNNKCKVIEEQIHKKLN